MKHVYLGVGANLGDPLMQLRMARQRLIEHPAIEFIDASGIYLTAPVGPQNQPDFYNSVFHVATSLAPEALLDALQVIESDAGRVRDGERWGPRTLDLDILLYADECIDTPRLTVPHAHLAERKFSLVPLLELAPSLEIPGAGRASAALERLPQGGIRRLDTSWD